MKRNVIIACLLFAFVFVQASAQTTPLANTKATRQEKLANTTPQQRAERQTKQMKQRLSLTADQETAVAAINLKYAQQAQSLIDGGERNRETLKQVREMMSSKDGELKKVLDKDQYNQYDAFRDDQRNQMKQNRRGNR